MAMVMLTGKVVFAQYGLPESTATPAVPKPLVLSVQEKIPDNTHFRLPKPPKKYNDGTSLKLVDDETSTPLGAPMLNLGEPAALQQVPAINNKDGQLNKYYWHPYNAWNYCHFHEGDRNWYGWRMGDTFHWVLWWSGRFWWHDPYAERWLYFNRGYWWWQSPGKPCTFQVYLLDGHYHVCDANGVLTDDLLKPGKEEDVTQPVPKPSPSPTLSGKHGGHHGGHRMDGGNSQSGMGSH
jgi:hypothetical protein